MGPLVLGTVLVLGRDVCGRRGAIGVVFVFLFCDVAPPSIGSKSRTESAKSAAARRARSFSACPSRTGAAVEAVEHEDDECEREDEECDSFALAII